MRHNSFVFAALAVGLVLASLTLVGSPTPAKAGGFPCFQCHGVNFEGSDIAPVVAGTKLTDEQIANQMRNPRGVMPAFGPGDWPDPKTAITYIRAQPTGKPTMAMSRSEKSAALALISGIAAARATAVLQPASSHAAASTATVVSPEATPGAATLAATALPIPTSAATAQVAGASSATPLTVLAVVAGLAILITGAWWVWQRQ